MATKRKNADGATALDISYSPDVRELAEEVARTRIPKSLRRGDEEIARIVPARKRASSTRYDSTKFRAAFEAAQEMWRRSGLDADDVITEIYRAREEGTRPANRP